MLSSTVLAVDEYVFCGDFGVLRVFKMIGFIIKIVQLLAPIVIIIFGIIDFGKAVLSGDEKELTIASSNMLRRFIIGVSIFFIPIVVTVIIDYLPNRDVYNQRFSVDNCKNCLLKPYSGHCDSAISTAKTDKEARIERERVGS